jgi:hypothetical protein
MSEQSLLLPSEVVRRSPKQERRVWARQVTNIESMSQPIAAETAHEPELSWPGHIIDISRGGIGLHLERRFQPGTSLIVEVSGPNTDPSRFLSVRVVHATLYTDGHWYHGCRFIVELSEEDLQTLL